MFKIYRTLMEQATDGGSDLPTNPVTPAQTNDPDAQKILDRLQGKAPEGGDFDDEDNELPSDKQQEPQDEPKEKLAGKYSTVEDLKKGIKSIGSDLPDAVIDGMSDSALEAYYKDLEKKFSTKDKRKDEQTTRKNVVDDNKKLEQTTEKPSSAIPDNIWSELNATFAEKGGITNEQYDQLAKYGIPDTMVDAYLDGLVAKQQQFTSQVYQLAGGEEQYKVIEAWANENLDETEIQYISSLPQDKMLLALKGVKARYDLANQGVRRIDGTTGQSGSSYRDQNEYLNDVRDPRYTRDKSFREKVEQKLKRSKL